MFTSAIFVVLLIVLFAAFWLTVKRGGILRENGILPKWSKRLHEISGNHTQVAGVLSGFSITVVVLIAGGRLAKLGDSSTLEEVTLGLFMVAFFGYVATGILYSLVIEHEKVQQFFLFSVASVVYYFSVVLSFIALLPLAQLLQYHSLKFVVRLMIVGSMIGGFGAVAIPFFNLFNVRSGVLVFMFILAISTAGTMLGIGLSFPSVNRPEFVTSAVLPLCAILISLIFVMCIRTFFSKRQRRDVHFAGQAAFWLFCVSVTVAYLTLLVSRF